MAEPALKLIGTHTLLCFLSCKGMAQAVRTDLLGDTSSADILGNNLAHATLADGITRIVQEHRITQTFPALREVVPERLGNFLFQCQGAGAHPLTVANM